MRTPLACLLSLLLSVPAPLLGGQLDDKGVGSVIGVGGPKDEAPPLGSLAPKKELVGKDFSKQLGELGYTVKENEDGDEASLQHKSGAVITHEMLEKADLKWKEGVLAYRQAGPVEKETLPKILDGLLPFARAASRDSKEVGRILQAWGVPPSFDGQHLLNPDGSATYYGMMLHEGLKDHPATLSKLSGERLAKSLELMGSAYREAFSNNAADAGSVQLERAWGLLTSGSKPGERTLAFKPYSMPGLDAGDAVLASETDPAKRASLEKAVAAAKQMKKHRYHSDLELTPPAPDKDAPPLGDPARGSAPPNPSVLATMLRWADTINGKPLAPEQQEALVKSFPFGESIWRMGVHKLWKDEITGKGVKVAVIDSGVAPHPHLEGRIAERTSFIRQRGTAAFGDHGTHVASTIAYLAPDAELRSYAVFEGRGSSPSLETKGDEVEEAIYKAVVKAVEDGNHVVNMSLGSEGAPTGPLAKLIDKYSREKGVIFVVTAGNVGKHNGRSPAFAKEAITVGAVNVNDRVTGFSSYGAGHDAEANRPVLKTIYLAPGHNIEAAVAPSFGPSAPYERMNGTSMAAPHTTGTVALLYQQARAMAGVANPVELSRTIKGSLDAGRPAPRNELPGDVPPDQDFVILDPVASYQALRSRSQAVGK